MLTRRFVNIIYGGNVNIASGQSAISATSIEQTINVGDWEHLERVLRGAGIGQRELDELSTAVTEDGQKIGSKVNDWIKRAAPMVLSEGVKMGAEVGKALLTEYLKRYCGMG